MIQGVDGEPLATRVAAYTLNHLKSPRSTQP